VALREGLMNPRSCHKDIWISAIFVCALGLSCYPVAAQTQSSSEGTVQLQEVVVTANRRGEENLQGVPMSITALDAGALNQTNINSLVDITRSVPGISVQELGGGQNTIVIRGITTDGVPVNTDTETQTPVSVYLDEMPISLAGATPDLRVFDLERVEVVRGPQGTLYGAGAMAGNIRYITRKPDPTAFSATVEGLAEETRSDVGYDVRGMLNAPLIDDKLAMRLSVYQGRDPGYIDNIATGAKNQNTQDNTQARLALRLQDIGHWILDGSFLYGRVKTGNSNGTYTDLGPYAYHAETPEEYLDRYGMSNFTATYGGDAFDFISSTSFVDRHIESYNSSEFVTEFFTSSFPGGPIGSGSYNLFKNDIKDFAQEFRLSSKSWQHWKGLLGAFYEHQTRDYWQNYPAPGFDALIGASSLSLGAFTPDTLFSETQDSVTRQLAFFGELTFVPNDRFDLTAGLRQFNWRQSFSLYSGGAFGIDPATGAPLTSYGDSSENGVNPRVNATFHATPDALIYAEAAKGFRYGGLNQPVPEGPAPACGPDLAAAGLTSAPETFGPDHVWTYSLGEKATLADRRVTVNTTAFLTNWYDVQTRHLLASCGYYYIRNKGDVRSTGIELEANWQATQAWVWGLSAGYTNAYANGPITDLGAPDGARAPYFPRVIASLSTNYRWSTPWGGLMLSADYSHRGESTTSFNTNDPTYRVIPASNVVNAALVLSSGQFDWRVFARDITNERIVVANAANLYAPYQPGDQEFVARPLTIGVAMTVYFGRR